MVYNLKMEVEFTKYGIFSIYDKRYRLNVTFVVCNSVR